MTFWKSIFLNPLLYDCSVIFTRKLEINILLHKMTLILFWKNLYYIIFYNKDLEFILKLLLDTYK